MKPVSLILIAGAFNISAHADPGEVGDTSPPDYEPICSEQSPYPIDFALTEQQFSLENAQVSLDRLEAIDAKMAETLWTMHNEQSVATAGPMFESQIEAVTIAHYNSIIGIRGFLLKEAALSAEGEDKTVAVTEFCDFVTTRYAAD